MKLIYLHLYKDTYSIFMQVYKPWEISNINKKNSQKQKNIHFNNLKEFLIVKLDFQQRVKYRK